MSAPVLNAPHHSNTDYTPGLDALTSIILALSTLAMGGRLYTRWLMKVPVGLDDILAPISYLALVANCVVNYLIGFYHLVSTDPPTPDQIKSGVKAEVSLGIIYPVCVLCSKLSLLFLLRRIFRMNKTWFRVSWWIIFLLMFPTWFTIALAFSCLQLAQGHLIPKVQEIAVPLVSFFAAVTDFLILMLPAIMVFNLQLNWKKRIYTTIIFAIGFLATVVSLIRSIRSIQSTNEHWDPRYVTFQTSALGIAEAGAIFICACLPIFGPLSAKIQEITIRSFHVITSRSSLGSKQSSGMGSAMSSKKSSTKPKFSVDPATRDYSEDETPIRLEDRL